MILHCILNKFRRKGRELVKSNESLKSDYKHQRSAFQALTRHHTLFLDSFFILPLSQILRAIKITKIKTLTPTHLCFKLLLNIYLIVIIVFSAFTSLNGSVTMATTSSSHSTFFKVTLWKQHIVPSCIVYSDALDNNMTAPIWLLLELSSPFQPKHISYATKCPSKLLLRPV